MHAKRAAKAAKKRITVAAMVQPPLFVKKQPVIVPDLLEKIVIFFHTHCGFQFLDDFNDRINLCR